MDGREHYVRIIFDKMLQVTVSMERLVVPEVFWPMSTPRQSAFLDTATRRFNFHLEYHLRMFLEKPFLSLAYFAGRGFPVFLRQQGLKILNTPGMQPLLWKAKHI